MPQASALHLSPQPGFAGVGSGFAVEEMRALLSRRRPATTAEALRMLREAYPASPLRLRIAACGA